jgi:hypothetical protein
MFLCRALGGIHVYGGQQASMPDWHGKTIARLRKGFASEQVK